MNDSPVLLNNRYLLEEPLGSGGMAVVYRAHDQMLERYVAIKILRESYSNDPEFQERFRQEARAAANLSHPNIVTVHDFGLDAGRLFIVMEYLPGAHLKSILQRRGSLPEEEAVSLMVQACSGVGYAHRAGLVHCDIKPHNLLITPDRRLKVGDFGIARALASIQPDEKSEVVWGSPLYFSPEQAAGNAPSPASDVYSLGVILYEMLTGQPPFQAESATELARLHRDLAPIPPRQIKPSISPALEQIMLKVLAKEPASRYRTADQFGRVLVSFTHPGSSGEVLSSNGETALSAPAAPTEAVRQFPVPAVTSPQLERQPAEMPRNASRPSAYTPPKENPFNMDWVTIVLGLLAIIALGGLVPLYIWVWFLYF